MCYIYNADVYCDDCGDQIKRDIAAGILVGTDDAELWLLIEFDVDDDVDDVVALLDSLDERQYDSGDYPKHCSDDEESDCPQHCGSGAGCINAHVFDDGDKCGCLIGSNLTDDGMEYVREAVREGGDVADLWKAEFDYIDFDDDIPA